MSKIQHGFFILLLLTMVTRNDSWAQEQNLCTQTLKEAHELYDIGRIHEVPALLDSCLQNGFSKAEKIQAYRLMILSYLFQDEDEKAEENLLSLLRLDPDYKVNEAIDPAEFVNLYNTYRTLPVVSIGLLGGVNQSRVSLKQEISTDNQNSSQPKYSPGYGYQFGLIADILLKKNYQLTTAILFSGKKYEMDNERMFGYTSLNIVESQNWLEIPVTLKYNFGKRKFKTFVQAGLSGNIFLSSNAILTRVSIADDNDASGPSVDVSDLRKRFNCSAVMGLGARYKIGYGYVILDIRYNLGLANVVNVENRYSNSELIYYYGHIDGDYKLNNINVSVGYLKSLYKPKKIKVNE